VATPQVTTLAVIDTGLGDEVVAALADAADVLVVGAPVLVVGGVNFDLDPGASESRARFKSQFTSRSTSK
jgi:hypothetical protein